MPRIKKEQFIPNVCEHCHQTTNTTYSLARGNAIALLAIHRKAQEKEFKGQLGIVNTRKEVAFGDGEKGTNNVLYFNKLIEMEARGNYSITTKGYQFLNGEIKVPRTIVVTKGSHGHVERVWEPDGEVSIHDLLKKGEPYWNEEYAKGSFIIKTEVDLEKAILEEF